jgi:hypothetical protein
MSISVTFFRVFRVFRGFSKLDGLREERSADAFCFPRDGQGLRWG